MYPAYDFTPSVVSQRPGLVCQSHPVSTSEASLGAHLFVADLDILIELRIKHGHSFGRRRKLSKRRLDQSSCRGEYPQRRRGQHLAIELTCSDEKNKANNVFARTRQQTPLSQPRDGSRRREFHFLQRDSPRSRTILPSFFGAWYTSFIAGSTAGYHRAYELM